MKNPVTLVSRSTIAALALSLGITTQAQAQIVPTPTGDPGATGTIVTPTNTQIDITAGTQAGSTLFHSFTQFDISKGQTANFQTPADIQNVLTRITNGNPSSIDGTLQLSGSTASLFLMNPAGIVFGPNASLNLPASFVGTTATSISHVTYDYIDEAIGTRYITSKVIFNASGANDYRYSLIEPTASVGKVAFLSFPELSQSGAIVNFGNLSVPKDLVLIGGAIHSTTDLNADNVVLGIGTSPDLWGINVRSDLNRDPHEFGAFTSNLIFSDLIGALTPNYPTVEKHWTFQSPNNNGAAITLNAGNINVQNINTAVRAELVGNQINVGDIEGEAVSIFAVGNIAAGNLRARFYDSPVTTSARTLFPLSLGLIGTDISASSLATGSDSHGYTANSNGEPIFIGATGKQQIGSINPRSVPPISQRNPPIKTITVQPEVIPIVPPTDPIVPPTNPIIEPNNPTPTPITELVESPQAPEFSEASVLNGTIDPTDTINLSAGAIRGAAINPGGLLKVELDTRNPEGVLTRKVTK